MTRRSHPASGGEPGHTQMGAGTAYGDFATAGSVGEGEAREEEKSEVWESFSKGFLEVQAVLEQNRVLIQQVNENHQSRIPDNLSKNVALIRQINCNISKVASMYSNLSSNFCSSLHQHRLGGRDDRSSAGGSTAGS